MPEGTIPGNADDIDQATWRVVCGPMRYTPSQCSCHEGQHHATKDATVSLHWWTVFAFGLHCETSVSPC